MSNILKTIIPVNKLSSI